MAAGVQFDVAHIPGFPVSVQEELDGGGVDRVVEIVGPFDGRVANQAELNRQPRCHC